MNFVEVVEVTTRSLTNDPQNTGGSERPSRQPVVKQRPAF